MVNGCKIEHTQIVSSPSSTIMSCMTEKGTGVSAPAKSSSLSAKDAFEISNSPNELVAASDIISSQSSLNEDYYDCQVAEEEDLRGGGGGQFVANESGDTLEVSSKAVKAAAAAVVVYSTVNKQVS